jgi:hypothetical protein
LKVRGEDDFSVRVSAADAAYAPLLSQGERVVVSYYDGNVSQYWIEAFDVRPD